jgi:branched-chain amino acid transport system ATP-binding protein
MTVDFGGVTALLGANGAGKTTTLLAIAGLLHPVKGRISVLGQPAEKLPCHRVVRLGLSLVPEGRGLVYEMTVAQNLRLHAPRGERSRVDEAYDVFPLLRPLTHRHAGLLSGGEQQMLALACAITAGRRILMIDELSHGLAPIVVEQLLPTVRAMAVDRQMAVVLVEQNVDAALRVADSCYVLNHGEVHLAGSAEEIRRNPTLIEAAYLGVDVPPA